ncbi:MAG: molybdopterin molybdotransferase MoeA [Bradymonadaceae bacterium]|nr:molybdopterin molybdotransferase MoeA [Lujinxingiaceae bacterium]
MQEFISVEQAQHQILSRIGRTAIERVMLSSAQGRTLARAVDAPQDAPRFDNSAMDGYALRFEDLSEIPASLKVVGTVAAGSPAERDVQPGEAMRIMTGALMPNGADTVVQQELCRQQESWVIIQQRPGSAPGANVRLAGSYMRAGKPVLRVGDRLNAADIGMLASFGKSVVEVFRKPTVAILSTGNELVELDRAPGAGQIVNSNAYMLEALVLASGATPLVLPIAADDSGAIRAAFEQALGAADLVISSGGVSVGEFDFVRDVMNDLSGGMAFWKVRLKPGKPLAFGVARNERSTPIIGLPGNPASSFVGFHLFVRPAIAVAAGVPNELAMPGTVRARLAETVAGASGRRTYLGGRLWFEPGAEPVFEPNADQGSGNVTLFSGCNALAIIDEEQTSIGAGQFIDVLLL